MCEYLGREYLEYKNETGLFFPKIKIIKNNIGLKNSIKEEA
ncbi:MAG: hypothetical protein N3A58_01805 [Spirochaetes bacterium]|nr:hypothetical protein [Spirochaetota bacterium]